MSDLKNTEDQLTEEKEIYKLAIELLKSLWVADPMPIDVVKKHSFEDEVMIAITIVRGVKKQITRLLEEKNR